MTHWTDQLREQLAHDRKIDRLRFLRDVSSCARIVRHNGRSFLNFAANDYLALAACPQLRNAILHAALTLPAGSGASPLISGHLAAIRKTEQHAASFKKTEAALLLSSGYLANLAAVTALVGPGDVIYSDKLNHASLIDAARLSGATLRVFPHRNLHRLRQLLDRPSSSAKPIRRRMIITDSVFSMDGDCADLNTLCDLRDHYQAILLVDEAHATGVLGPHGAGLAEQLDLQHRIDVTITTASKSLGFLGGIITASQLIIDTIINKARPYIFSTAVSPILAAAIDTALTLIQSASDQRAHLHNLAATLRAQLRDRNWDVRGDSTPIIPIVTGSSASALALAHRLESAHILAPAIRFPSVPHAQSRIRITLRADHTHDDLHLLLDALGSPSPSPAHSP